MSSKHPTKQCPICGKDYIFIVKKREHTCGRTCTNIRNKQIAKARRTDNVIKRECANLECNIVFDVTIDNKHQRFHDQSCSAKTNNQKRTKEYHKQQGEQVSLRWEQKLGLSTHRRLLAMHRKLMKAAEYPFTAITRCKCRECNRVFYSSTQQQLCSDHEHLYARKHKAKFKFKFKLTDFPELFDLTMIDIHGWYSTGPTQTIKRSGLSKDHKISICDALINGYDQYYISHPLNCELMLHSDNKIKGTRSSITYTELVESINEFDLQNNRKQPYRLRSIIPPSSVLLLN
jgi:hypothetical protein